MAEVIGFEKTLRAMGAAKKKVEHTIEEGLKKVGEIIKKKADTYVPVMTGYLKMSGEVVVEGKGMGTKLTIVYRAPYAVYVHEDLDATHAPPTCAKYLEKAIRETRGTCKAALGREIVGANMKV